MNAPLRQIAKTCSFLCLLSVLLLSERAHAINCKITVFPINFGIYMPLDRRHLMSQDLSTSDVWHNRVLLLFKLGPARVEINWHGHWCQGAQTR